MRFRYNADISLLNNGFLRSDCIIEPGRLSYKIFTKLLPIVHHVCLLKVPGKTLLEALENGVSKYPGFDGRFASVSGMKFTFDPKLPPNSRILKESIELEKGKFHEEEVYLVAVTDLFVRGNLLNY